MLWIIGALFAMFAALRPGLQVLVKNSPSPRSAPTDTGVWFVTGLTDAGAANTPIDIFSTDDFNTKLGGRVSYSGLYDSIDTFFREGGAHAVVSRVVGPAAVRATRNLLDGAAAVSLTVTAIGPGTYYNALKIQVIAGVGAGTYRILVLDANNNTLEQSYDLTTQVDAQTWSQFSNYVRITVGASANPPVVAAAANLAGGADDRANIVDAQWQAALDAIPSALGPGQVSAPGRTTAAGHLQLLAHAAAKNRFALLDLADTPSSATLTAALAADGHSRYGMTFAPWVIVPGVVANTQRTVPPSALAAGAIARTDAQFGPDTPAAGARGIANFAIGLSQPAWDATTRDALNTAGVNVIRQFPNDFRIYGWRSMADPNADPSWVDAGVPRLLMAIVNEAMQVGETFMFDVIDGQGRTLSAYAGALSAVCQRFFNEGNLYGASAADAFNVDVGPTVNTPASLAGNELRANIAVRPSPDAELITINIVNVPITQEVS
jgi:phage tail sheath protein FI